VGQYEYISKDLTFLKIGKIQGTFHKKDVHFIANDDINTHKISVCNGSGINYIILAEDMKYFSHKPQCYAAHKLRLLSSHD